MRFGLKFNSILLFLCLTLLASLFEYFLFKKDVISINENTTYLFKVEDQRVKEYLKRYANVLYEYKSQLEKEEKFNANLFGSLAHQFITHFKDIQAFNFVSSSYEITKVFPESKNKAALGKNLRSHPDPVVGKVFQEGISKTNLTFIPPVKIYQGGSAIIFYMPVRFKDGDSGWMNVVILAKNLFKNYRSLKEFSHVDFLVRDNKTDRFFMGPKTSDRNEVIYRTFSTTLFDRPVDYIFNISSDINKAKERAFRDFLILLIAIFLMVILFFKYGKSREEIYSNYVNIRSESNLLKTLIHDLSNPVQVVLLSLESLKRRADLKDTESKTLEYAIHNQMAASEIINTVRSIYKKEGSLLRATDLNVYQVVSEVIASISNEIQDADLELSMDISENIVHGLKMEPSAFKNHIFKNIISNAVKFASEGSKISINFDGKSLLIQNYADSIDPQRFNELNNMEEQLSTKDNKGNSSLGLGLFIAKVFCLHAKIKFSIEQDPNSGLVTSKLEF